MPSTDDNATESAEPIPLYPTINNILKHCNTNQVKMYAHLEPKVTELYKEMNAKLEALYQPVIEACTSMRDNRNSRLITAMESSLTNSFLEIIKNCNAFTFYPGDLKKHFTVDVWTPEFDTHDPYCDSQLVQTHRLRISISVSFPTIANNAATDRLVALTATDYDTYFLGNSCLQDYDDYTVTRCRDHISFDFDYELDDLDIPHDNRYCSMPDFPLRPVHQTQ
tara:strand:+ start:153 stop:821 length:669 start_codon:yes stop_codon:yes gene_type:complete